MVSLVAIGPAWASTSQTPTESVRSTIEDVVRILTNEQLKQPERLAERRQEIERVVRERVSYEDMAKQALGVQWLSLEASERQEFVDLFVQLLRDSFAGKIDAYGHEAVVAFLASGHYRGADEALRPQDGHPVRVSDDRLRGRVARV